MLQALWGAAPLAVVTGRQVPVVLVACPFSAAVHAEQPVQSLLQQTPSATIPDVHSYCWVAGEPLGFAFAQVPAVVSQ